METLAILVVLEARAGREGDVEAFLKEALPMARAEREVVSWYALKLDRSRFGIFDTFTAEEGRVAHLSGAIAQALFARAEELFSAPPVIERIDLLAVKAPEVQARD